jgi:glycosyltransferase involved in cell wall biosynthesis
LKISATIITFNEEKNIERCIQSLKSVADEIIVVDSFSTDNTEEICKKHNVQFIQSSFTDFGTQKNVALSYANNDFVISLDADEVLSDVLINRIKNLEFDKDCYFINRLTYYCGSPIRHCGWYPDRKLRIWIKNRGNWTLGIHERVKMVDGTTSGFIDGDILHFSINSIEDHITQMNKFSTIAAKEAIKKGKKANLFVHVILNPIYTFINKYFFHLGFLDGFYGFVICYLSAVSNFLKYTKIRQLNKHGR